MELTDTPAALVISSQRWSGARLAVGAAALLIAIVAPGTVGRGAGAAAVSEPDAVVQILVIFSDDPSQSWIRDLTDGITLAPPNSSGGRPVWYFEYLDAVRFQHEGRDQEFLTAMRDKYRDRRPDLVVAVASNAIDFAVSTHATLWPEVPLLLASYGGTAPRVDSTLRNVSSLSFEYGFDAAMATAKAVFPGATTIYVTSGLSAVERVRERDVDEAIRRAGMAFVDLAAPSTAAALAKVAQLPEDALLFIAGGQVDADGRVIPTWQLCEMLAATANRPALMLGAQFLGCGIVGGLMRDYEKIGTIIGERAVAAASGAALSAEVVRFATIATLAFDERQLERWHVDERRLPPGSTVSFRRPSLWRDYRNEVIIVIGAVAIQSLLIAGLLYERRARRDAELDSRRSLSLAAHVDRRSAMTALTGSIAHELNQPLASILHNAQAAEMLVTSNRATIPALQEILRDIRAEDARASQIVQRHRAMLQRHELEKVPLDLHAIIRESLALIAHDAAQRQVHIAADLPAAPCIVVGDHILLQQVVVNLLLNAMDAMAQTPPAQRRVTVCSTIGRRTVEVALSDRGPGVPPHVINRLFEPFVTTKPAGLGIGLAIARSTIEALEGTIDARNNPEGGATFRFTLPIVNGTR
jgi:signal transduction histidine kinase